MLHELGDIPTPQVEITVPRRRTTRVAGVRLRRGTLTEGDVTIRDGLPVTTVERTITDLLADQADGGHIGGVLAEALHRDLIDADHLAHKAAEYAPSYGQPDGRHLLQHLLDQTGADVSLEQQGNDESSKRIQAIATQLAKLDIVQLNTLKYVIEVVEKLHP